MGHGVGDGFLEVVEEESSLLDGDENTVEVIVHEQDV